MHSQSLDPIDQLMEHSPKRQTWQRICPRGVFDGLIEVKRKLRTLQRRRPKGSAGELVSRRLHVPFFREGGHNTLRMR